MLNACTLINPRPILYPSLFVEVTKNRGLIGVLNPSYKLAKMPHCGMEVKNTTKVNSRSNNRPPPAPCSTAMQQELHSLRAPFEWRSSAASSCCTHMCQLGSSRWHFHLPLVEPKHWSIPSHYAVPSHEKNTPWTHTTFRWWWTSKVATLSVN